MMKKLLGTILFMLCLFGAEAADRMRSDTIYVDQLIREDRIRGDEERPFFNALTVQAGYAMYNVRPGKYGYDFALEYDCYMTRNFYGFSTYMYSFSNNAEEYKSTGHNLRGRIQSHMLAVGLGYDMLKRSGHRIYGNLGIGFGYQSYREEYVTREFPTWSQAERTTSRWAFTYMVSAGYSYSVLSNLEIGVNWTGYFLPRYWANSFNLRLGYKF